jgi:hypothetical protein
MKNINNAEMKVKDMRTTTLNDVRPINRIPALLVGMLNSFQRQGAGKLNAIYDFTFTGEKVAEATVGIREGTIKIENGLNGDCNIDVVADGETWLGEGKNLFWALLTRRIRLRGNPKWLLAFKRCFPL